MANYMSPGVYLTEVDYSEYTVDTSSCVVGMVGAARRGPVGVPTLVTTQEQMVGIFGEPVEGEYGVYSALQVLAKANRLYYTRVVRSGVKASAGSIGTDKIIYTAKAAGPSYNGIQVVQSALEDGEFSIRVVSEAGDELESYTNLTLRGADSSYIETVVNGVSNYITADVQYSGTLKATTYTLGSDKYGEGSGSYARAGVDGTDKIIFRSTNFDSDLNGCVAVLSEMDSYGFFDITIKDGDDDVIERWPALSIDPASTRFAEKVVNRASKRIIVTVNTDELVEFVGGSFVFSGGDDAIDGISATDIIGETSGTGLYSFSNPETVSIDILTTPGWSDIGVVQEGIYIAESRADCIYLIDTPFGLSAQEVISWTNGTDSYGHNGFDTSYAAVYWPWVKISDAYTGKDIWLPPSGMVAGAYAYNDEVAHPWNAPAGLERGRLNKAIGVELNPTQGERDAVYGNRNVVNPIVNFISNGIVIWGQKTCQRTPTSLDRVNVRRLMNYLKRTIGNTTRSFVFEQNVDSTWERWKTAVEPILINTKNNDGLYEYKIVLEASDADIENNRMPIDIYIKPTKTAEFISLKFNIMQYSASFDSL